MREPLHRLSAVRLAQMIAQGEASSEVVTRSFVDAIRAREKEIQAFAWFDADRAIAVARELHLVSRRGPLHGLPVAIKDNIDTADMPTGYGSIIYEGHRPHCDAACVGRNVSRADKTRADGCYQLTLFARDFFEARNAGVPLDQARARLTQMARDDKLGKDLAARLEKLAVSVYGSGGKDYGTQAPQFRTALFVECVAPRPDR